MIQRFIELGKGYSDLFELVEIARSNKHRLHHLMALHTEIGTKSVTSLIVILKPTDPGNFQPLYICREGIPNPSVIQNKRFNLFKELAEELEKEIIQFKVKASGEFADRELFYQYLTGILRLNHYIAPLQ